MPQHLKLVGNLARLLEASILVIYFSEKKEELEVFQRIQQEVKSRSNYSKIKFSFFENEMEPCSVIKEIKQEQSLCALAFSSEDETLTHSIFGHTGLHTSIPIFAL